VVHDDLGPVVRSAARREELTDVQVRDRAMEERTVIERLRHLDSFRTGEAVKSTAHV
jgi:IS5 family transposase